MKVQVQIVTYNSSATIKSCIHSLLNQEALKIGENLIVRVLDNNSTDSTVKEIQSSCDSLELSKMNYNTGFCLGNNILFKKGLEDKVDYFLLLNPDALLEKDCIKNLVTSLGDHPESGWATPHLIRTDNDLKPSNLTDSKGIYFTKEFRHFDRDSGVIITEEDSPQYVIGASGACAIMSKRFVKEVSKVFEDEFQVFNNSFFAYREDAELSIRASYLGWKCLYVPKAKAYHQRQVLHTNRSSTSNLINSHSIKNRFLMKLSSGLVFFSIKSLLRDFMVIGHTLLVGKVHFPALRSALYLKKRIVRIKKNITMNKRVSKDEVKKILLTESTPAIDFKENTNEIKGKCSVVIVNFNSGDLLLSCLESCLNEHQVIIVDNNSTDSSYSEVKNKYNNSDNIKFIHNSTNLGFAGAFNQGLSYCTNNLVLLLNPDIILGKLSTKKLIEQISKANNIAALSPMLIGRDNKLQEEFVFKKLPTPLSLLCELYGLNRLSSKLNFLKTFFYKDNLLVSNFIKKHVDEALPHYKSIMPIEQPPAACLLMRKDLIGSVNNMSEDYFPAWFEDVDLCRKLYDKGLVSAVTNKVEVKHLGGYSVSKIGKFKFFKIYYRNMIKYVKNHHGISSYYIFIILSALPAAGRLLINKFSEIKK